LQYTKEEQRAVIRFLWTEVVKSPEVHRRMLLQYGDNCLAQRRVYEWVELLRIGRIRIVDERGPCRRRTASIDGYAERDKEMIRANRRVRVNVTADTMAISTVMCIHFSQGLAIHEILLEMGAKRIND